LGGTIMVDIDRLRKWRFAPLAVLSGIPGRTGGARRSAGCDPMDGEWSQRRRALGFVSFS
jgi:hypothetical protein